MSHDFVQVDVFTNRPLYGNPAAVIFEADDLPAQTMQKIAREMNLSETVFILNPTISEADYRIRIFTPKNELPFAGHPTIAAAHAVRLRYPDKAALPLLRQECGIGIVPVEVISCNSRTLLRMTQDTPTCSEAPLSRATMAQMLGCADSDLADSAFEVVSTGIPWLIAELSSLEAVSTLAPDLRLIEQACSALNATGLTVFTERTDETAARIRVRTFAPGEGVAEDPACGSCNGCVAAYIARHKHGGESAGSYVAEQGIEIDRDSLIYASWERIGKTLSVRIGGEAVVSASGKLHV